MELSTTALAERARAGCAISLDRLARNNVGLVAAIARSYRHHGVPLEDLIASGQIGLIEASRRFDPGRDATFATYAGWWIRKHVLKALRDHGRLVPIPRYQRRRHGHLLRLPREVSLDAPESAGGNRPLGERLADPSPSTALTRLVNDQEIGSVREALRRLAPRKRDVIALRFGLGDAPRLSLVEVGEILRLSRERVRQIECESLVELRNYLLRRRTRIKRGCPTSDRRSRETGSRTSPS